MPVNYALYHPKWPLISRLIRFLCTEISNFSVQEVDASVADASMAGHTAQLVTGSTWPPCTWITTGQTTGSATWLLCARDAICSGITSGTSTTVSMARKPITAMKYCFQLKTYLLQSLGSGIGHGWYHCLSKIWGVFALENLIWIKHSLDWVPASG